MSQLGLPYRYGGSSPATGFDCSGLTSWAWARAGVSLPRTAAAQYGATQRISVDHLQPGDLVFFSGLGHVGMYIGGGQMVHSPRTGKNVEVVPIFRGGFSYVGAGRVR
jgi:cell wall-associated NlpC family hydrolase